MKRLIYIGLLGLMVTSCSSHHEEQAQSDQESIELSKLENTLEGNEVIEDPNELKDDSIVHQNDTPSNTLSDQMIILDEDGKEKIISTKEGEEKKAKELIMPSTTPEVQESTTASPSLIQDTSIAPVNDSIPTTATYQVQKGDTLMWISFKIYDDYTKWRHLAHQNAQILKGKMNVAPGTKIEYTPPVEEFNWNPTGEPYLVKKGDTLGLISKDVYGIEKRWREIFENNRPLIRNPNLIFAGFTIYYRPDGKDVASSGM